MGRQRVAGAKKPFLWRRRNLERGRAPVMGRQRVAGATVEEAISDDINAWQAQVSKKPPLEEPRTWQGQTRDGKATRGRS